MGLRIFPVGKRSFFLNYHTLRIDRSRNTRLRGSLFTIPFFVMVSIRTLPEEWMICPSPSRMPTCTISSLLSKSRGCSRSAGQEGHGKRPPIALQSAGDYSRRETWTDARAVRRIPAAPRERRRATDRTMGSVVREHRNVAPSRAPCVRRGSEAHCGARP